MSNKLTILFAPLDGYGHVNACTGVAEALRDRGHRIVFAIEKSWKGKLINYGFEEELYSDPSREENEKAGEFWVNFFIKAEKVLPLSPIEQLKGFGSEAMELFINQALDNDSKMKEIIDRIKPDVIVVDSYVTTPSILKSGIPWVLLVSANPLVGIEDERTPPCFSGLPTDGDRDEWKKFENENMEVNGDIWRQFNDKVMEQGLPPLPKLSFIHTSDFANIYMFPKELDYTDIRPIPPKWYQFDTFIRTESEAFEIPDKLKDKSGKLIYLSMGSMGSADLKLMTRLVSILSKCSHRVIVSKGALHDKYELPDNMWGQQTLPQTKILPLIDLVITHGGNNTLTEAFFFGKPMIVMPLFGDQFDNAHRIVEKDLGIHLNAYYCSEEELLESVDRLLNDKELAQKLKKISERIQSSGSTVKASQLIESLVIK